MLLLSLGPNIFLTHLLLEIILLFLEIILLSWENTKKKKEEQITFMHAC